MRITMATHKTFFVTAHLNDRATNKIHHKVNFRLHFHGDIVDEDLVSSGFDGRPLIVEVDDKKRWVFTTHRHGQFNLIYTREFLVGRLERSAGEDAVYIKEGAVYAATMLGPHFQYVLKQLVER